MGKTVSLYTLGCKLNYSETSAIQRQLEDSGFAKARFEEGADIYVINTCSVTDHADRKCKKVVREALKFNPNAFIAIVGCYAQLKPKEISQIPGVDVVLGAAEKFNLVSQLAELSKREKGKVIAGDIKDVNTFSSSYSYGDRTRTFLKVQDGCDYSCAFCTIPLARGKSRNAPIEVVIQQANEIAAKGVKEIVITGVNTGDFGRSTGENFFDLCRELDKTEGIERIRISSIEPNLLHDDLIDFVAVSKRFVPHFHIPLQSASDKMLRMMRRRYLRNVYSSRVQRIKQLMPNACIGVDVIVGHPGETREDFIDTYNFINDLDVSYLHVFTYSERPDTLAISLPNAVPGSERHERNTMLRILSEKKRRYFYSQFMGQAARVLWEGDNENGYMHGFTDNYIKVKTAYDPMLVNELSEVKLISIDAEGEMLVELIEQVVSH